MIRSRNSSGADLNLPAALSPLADLAHNLRWTWDGACEALFEAVDRRSWDRGEHNPIKLLRGLTTRRQAQLTADAAFMADMRRCRRALGRYLRATTWYREKYGRRFKGRIAYFCMEYGLHASLPIYAGGLGILAGDHVKSASDLGIPLVGVGIFWRQGYSRQRIGPNGRQIDRFATLRPEDTPLREITNRSGAPLRLTLPVGSDIVVVRGWRLEVGRVPLVLLDTDLPENDPKARQMTGRLYSGDRETRIRQEILLGVGGWRFLQAMRQPISVCHLNEGHAAFAALDRIAERIAADGGTFSAARKQVAGTNVFTTHTPVPAGNETFDTTLLDEYVGHYADKCRLGPADFLGLGRVAPGDGVEPFGMTPLACRLSERRNGVSALHGAVARRMWKDLWPTTNSRPQATSRRRSSGRTGVRVSGRVEDAHGHVPIGSVTNGIHLRTWLHPRMAALLDAYLPPGWEERQDRARTWRAIARIPDGTLWALHQELKGDLVAFVRERLLGRLRRNGASTARLAGVDRILDPEALTIGFARRFAPYKRADLVFHDVARFARLVNHAGCPVQIIFAGKAHPADTDGKALVARVGKLADSPRFRERVVFVEDYDMKIARRLVAGVDLWLNNPRKPQEASGTSGMKPALHGGLNLSILDGWWPEGYDGTNGWAIGRGLDHNGSRAHDRRDAAELYRILERQVVPLYFDRKADGLPIEWVRRMKHAMMTIPAVFNTHRQVKEYWSGYYLPALRRAER